MLHGASRREPRSVVAGVVQRFGLDVPRVATGVIAEVGWTAAHLMVYPLGLRPGGGGGPSTRGGLDGLSPAQRGLFHQGVAAAETPILLVHGIADNRTIFTVLARTLRRRGFRTLTTHDYGLLTRDLRGAARRLGEAVEGLVAATGYERVHVVGHSLGGLIARYYVQRLGGDARVDTLVTLGTPHGGTEMARMLPRLPLIRQLAPASDVIAELAEPAPGCRTRFLAFHSNLDHLIVPGRHGAIDHPDLDARNVAVRGVGHMSLPNNGRIAHEIAATLGGLRPDGRPEDPAGTLRAVASGPREVRT